MRKREITRQTIEAYSQWLYQNEKSPATIQKYRHSLELFSQYAKGRPVSKELVLKWKEQLRERMAPGTVNGALAALNGFFRYKHWEDCVVKLIRIRKRVYCLEQKELNREEWCGPPKTRGMSGWSWCSRLSASLVCGSRS